MIIVLSRDISKILNIVSSTSSASPYCGPRWLVLIITSWQANDVTEIFDDHVIPASRRELLGVYQTFSGILLTPCWLLCCKSGMHWKCRESKEKYMTSHFSGSCEDPRIPKNNCTRMAWWNLAHKMWPGLEWLAVHCRTFVDHPTLRLQMYFQWHLGSKARLKAAVFKFYFCKQLHPTKTWFLTVQTVIESPTVS